MLPFLKSPELIFGICSPIGTDNKKVINLIKNELSKYSYSSVDFKITRLMQSFRLKDMPLLDKPFELRYDTYIKYTNKLRELYGDSSLLGMLCCGAIRGHRRRVANKPDAFLQQTAYLFDQFKRKEEISILRQVYGEMFILVSIYSNKEARCKRLTERIAESHSVSRPKDQYEATAKDLMRRDEDERAVPTGQRLREAFPLADLFLDVDNEPETQRSITRFFQALFGANSTSPTPSEYGMYLAKTASLRSLDVSRQVGAAITFDRGAVVTLGCNEVPRAKGGQYWSDDEPDARDFFIGIDENDRLKKIIPNEDTKAKTVDSDLEKSDVKGSALSKAELFDIIEFGRIVHAEMSALCEASRLGKSVEGATLFCTTFPCHLCAKHIVASGIIKVVYIEPYPKSYAEQFHADSIVVQTGRYDGDKVQFECFTGISPVRYRTLFSRGKRKDDHGKSLAWEESTASPQIELTVATYLANEAAIIKRLSSRLAELGETIGVSEEYGPFLSNAS